MHAEIPPVDFFSKSTISKQYFWNIICPDQAGPLNCQSERQTSTSGSRKQIKGVNLITWIFSGEDDAKLNYSDYVFVNKDFL